MIKIAQQPNPSKRFELVLCIKDSQGKPTDHWKTIETNSSAKLAYFWYKHNPPQQRRTRNKKKRSSSNILPSAQEAEKILKEMYKDKE